MSNTDNLNKPDLMAKNCPACLKNIPAYKTKVGDVNLLCGKHKAELDKDLHSIIQTHSDPMAEDDSKLDLLLERYKDYVLGSQNVYFTGSNLALDKKEAKAAINAYTTNKITEELKKPNQLIYTQVLGELEVFQTLAQKPKRYEAMTSYEQTMWVIETLGLIGSTLDERILELKAKYIGGIDG
jgi:hypothetical protein